MSNQKTDKTVEIINGPHQDHFVVAGRSVSEVRSILGDVFNIDPGAEALIDGHQVPEEAILLPGQILEFCHPSGSKGLGDLLTPEQLKERWGITDEQYRRLLDMGLPIDPVTGWHPEMAVDEWWREQVRKGLLRIASAGNAVQPTSQETQWCHPASENPPPKYPAGPLVGTKAYLARGLHHDGKCVPSRFEDQATLGVIWVRKQHYRRYEVWFRNEQEFALAQRRAAQASSTNCE